MFLNCVQKKKKIDYEVIRIMSNISVFKFFVSFSLLLRQLQKMSKLYFQKESIPFNVERIIFYS